MALEATHIRFALDLKEKYKILDFKKYVSGTIYPDSRYVTGIDRILTHPKDYLNWNFETISDFKKGWFVHLLTDKIQWLVTKEKIPQAFEGEIGQGSEVWIKHTALKVLQDINDLGRYDIKEYFSYFDYVENLNGEDIEKVKQYNQIFPKMYALPEKVNIDSYCQMWKLFGVGDELVLRIKRQAEEYSEDRFFMEKMLEIYPEMLKRAMNQ